MDELEKLMIRTVGWDYFGRSLGGELLHYNNPVIEDRRNQLRAKLAEHGLAKLTDADEKQAAELFGWLKERIMASLPPFSREVQAWINAEDTTEYNRRRRLVLEKLDQMKLRSIGEATEAQQTEIREWIAGNP